MSKCNHKWIWLKDESLIYILEDCKAICLYCENCGNTKVSEINWGGIE